MPPVQGNSLSNDDIIALIEKSFVGTATGGQLSDQQVREFVDLMIDQTAALNEVRVETGIRTSLTIDGLEFGEPVIVAGEEATEPDAADIVTPDMPRLKLTPVEILAAVDISFDFIRKNIRGADAERAINEVLAKRIGMDIVRLVFNGDTDLPADTRLNKALRIFDGILKQAAADGDVHDVTIAAAPVYTGADSEFGKMLRAIPKEYRDDRSVLRHFVSVDTLDDYEDEVSARQTAAADAVLFGSNALMSHKRVKIVPVYGFPNEEIITTVFTNIALGFGREMEFYREDKFRARKVELTIVTDLDAGYVFGGAMAQGAQA